MLRYKIFSIQQIFEATLRLGGSLSIEDLSVLAELKKNREKFDFGCFRKMMKLIN